MSKHLMKDLGENVEYVRAIVNSTIELKKIELTETSSRAVGVGILCTIIGIIALFVLSIAIILSTLLIAQSMQSLNYALLIMGGILLLFILIIYLLRKPLIFKPITNIFYSSLLK